jgi:hypothetical protein
MQNFIVEHQNFVPRSVEFITSKEVVSAFSPSDFKDFIYESFNKPSIIWNHAYSYQIKEDDRLLLNTLLSFGESAYIEDLEKAFYSRINYEIKSNNKSKEIHAFHNSLKRLEGFLIIKDSEVNFKNHSIVDFLLDHLRKDFDEVIRIAESACHITQLTKRLFPLYGTIRLPVPGLLKFRLLNDYASFIKDQDKNIDLILLALVIFKYLDINDSEDVLCKILGEIDDWKELRDEYEFGYHFADLIEFGINNSKIKNVIEKNLVEIVTIIITSEDNFINLVNMLVKFSSKARINFTLSDTSKIEDHLNSCLTEFIDQEVDWLKYILLHEDEAEDKINEIRNYINEINDTGLKLQHNLKEFYNEDWNLIATNNNLIRSGNFLNDD